jgi:asparagine synthase (glutamine-hydrolysing)
MCGIAGLVAHERSRLTPMLERLAHRGPDARAVLDLSELGVRLGHARLAILDLDRRADQPFVSSCGRYAIVFNGEIYNYLELRSELAREGVVFRTTSDTEVLLHWLARRGEEGLARLDGMFALGLVDRVERTLLLCRDAIGEKPLYYATCPEDSEWTVAFASEIKGLLALRGIDTRLDGEALADYLRFLYTAAPRTLYRGVRELAPGHLLKFALRSGGDPTEVQPKAWYDLEARVGQPFAGSYGEAQEEFRALAAHSLRLRLRSDVPVGFYLSGGLDSNCLLGLARRDEPTRNFRTYTIRYGGSGLSRSFDESGLAARSAAHWNAENLAIDFREGGGPGALREQAERIVALFDQPFGNATALVSEQVAVEASRQNKVCLVGDGGDELLAGYPRHRALAAHRLARGLPAPLRAGLLFGSSLLRESGRLATFARRARLFADGLEQPLAQSYVDWSSYALADQLRSALGRTEPTALAARMSAIFERHAAEPLRAAALVDYLSFVPFNLMQAADRTAMAHGLELRSPWLSTGLVEFSLSLPERFKSHGRRTKPFLLDAFGPGASGDLALLPPFLLERTKKPFNPPMEPFLRRHLGELRDNLTRARAKIGGVLDSRWVRKELADFESKRRDNSTLLWGLLALECWLGRDVVAPAASSGSADFVREPAQGAAAQTSSIHSP